MNFGENWELRIDPEVHKQTKRFPLHDRQRIFEVIESLKNNPYQGDIEKLEGEEHTWRRRVGVYRIFLEIYQQMRKINVFRVKRRGSYTY